MEKIKKPYSETTTFDTLGQGAWFIHDDYHDELFKKTETLFRETEDGDPEEVNALTESGAGCYFSEGDEVKKAIVQARVVGS